MPNFHTAGLYADTGLDGEEIGTLVVIVDRAKNLPNRRTMGKQDPYCAARLGKEAKKTDTDRRGGQTPRWDQELRFTVHDGADFHNLKVTIFNDDRKSDLIGEAVINLDELLVPGGGTKDGWHNLSCKGRYAGELRMEFTFYDTRSHEERQPQQKSSEPSASAASTMLGPRAQAPVQRRPLPSNPPVSSNHSASAGYPPHAGPDNQPEYYDHDSPAPQQYMPQEYDQEPLPEVYNDSVRPLPSFPQMMSHGNATTSGASSASLRAHQPAYEQTLQEQYDAQQYGYCDDPYALEQVEFSDKYPVDNEYEDDGQNRYAEPMQYRQPPAHEPAYFQREAQQPPPLMHTHSEPEVYQPHQQFGKDIPDPNHYSYGHPDRQQGAYSYPPPAPHPYQRPLPQPQPATQRFSPHTGHQQQRPVPPQPVHSHSAPTIPPVERQYPHTHLFKQPTRALHMPTSADEIPESQPEPRRTSDPYNYPQRPIGSHAAPHLPPKESMKPQAVGRLRASEGSVSNHSPSRSEPPSQATRSGNPTSRRSYGSIPLYTTHVAGQEDSPPEPPYTSRASNSRDPPARGYNPDLPLLKPRAISPTRDTAPETPPPQQQPSRLIRKSISPAAPKGEPKPFATPFSPDSFDQLNPQTARSAPVTPANNSSTTSDGRIIRSDGKTIDPTDHLPGHTWAPEPEVKVKKPTVTVNVRRFGPRDAPSSAPPSTTTNSAAAAAAFGPPSSSPLASRPRASSKPLAPTLPTTLNAAVNSPYPPPVPGKVPLSPVRSNIDDYEPGGNMSALHRELSGIDIGPSTRRSFLGRKKANPLDSDY